MSRTYFALILLCLLGGPGTLVANYAPQDGEPIVLGYYEQWGIYSPNVHIQDLPLERLTHLVYLAADVNEQGEVIVGDVYSDIQHMYPDQNQEDMPFGGSFGQLARIKPSYPHLRTLISIGGWSRSKYFSRLASEVETREKLAHSIVTFMERYQFDGVEIDWQFPIEDNAVPDSQRPDDSENFTELMHTIRRHMQEKSDETGKQYFLSAVTHQALTKATHGSLQKAANALDFITLPVSYLNGYWDKQTNHMSPVYIVRDPRPDALSINKVISQHIEAGVPAEKIVFDTAPFAIGWQGIKNENNGLLQNAAQASWGSWEQGKTPTGVYSRKHLNNLLKTPGYKRYWNDEAKSVSLFNPKRFDGHFVSYEDRQSLESKIDYIKDNRLAGIAVRKLHSDTRDNSSLVFTIFDIFYPVQSTWLIWQDFYLKNQATFLITAPIFLLIFVFLVAWKILQIRKKQEKLKATDQFYWIRDQLQLLEWPLTQMQLASRATDTAAEKLQISKLKNLSEISAKLLKPVTFLLTRTKLNQSNRSIMIQAINGFDLSNQLKQALPSYTALAPQNIRIAISSDISFYSDPIYMVQLIVELCQLLLCKHAEQQDEFSLTGKLLSDGSYQLNIVNQTAEATQVKHQIFLKIKDIYKIAQPLGIGLVQLSDSDGVGFKLFIPTINSPVNALPRDWAINKNAELSKLQPGSNESAIDYPIAPHKDISHESKHLDSLRHFSEVEPPARDIGKLINQACEYFAVTINKPLNISIYQDQHLITQLGDQIENSSFEESYEMGEFQFLIQSAEALEMEDIQFFSILMNQIQLVRKALQEIMKEPALLSELYELAANKEKLSYLKADKGYSAIYLSNEESPHYISLRLRTIKQYFEDDALLQIHRSYLVNPKKVTKVIQVNKLKFELEINNTRLPISRPYIPTLKNRHPHWFTEKAYS